MYFCNILRRYSPLGDLLASGSKDKSVRLWCMPSDGSEPACTCTLPHHAATVWSVAFSPNGLQLASSAGDGSIQLWRLCAGGTVVSPSKALAAQTGLANAAIAYNPRGRQLVSSSGDERLNVYL